MGFSLLRPAAPPAARPAASARADAPVPSPSPAPADGDGGFVTEAAREIAVALHRIVALGGRMRVAPADGSAPAVAARLLAIDAGEDALAFELDRAGHAVAPEPAWLRGAELLASTRVDDVELHFPLRFPLSPLPGSAPIDGVEADGDASTAGAPGAPSDTCGATPLTAAPLRAPAPRWLRRIQRRQAFRVRTAARARPSARVRHEAFGSAAAELPVLDVSASGCGLFLPESAPGLADVSELRRCEIVLDAQTRFIADLRIQHRSAVIAEGSALGNRLGCEIVAADPEALRALQRYVDRTQKSNRLLASGG